MNQAQVKREAVAKVREFMQTINAHYGRTLDTPKVRFGITRPGCLGTGGGKLKIQHAYALQGLGAGVSYVPGSACVSFNLLGLCNLPELTHDTIGHEVAHAVEVQLYPAEARMVAHGRPWREVMAVLGLEPRAHSTHKSTETGGIPHTCGCPGRVFGLSKVKAARAHTLRCRVCGQGLTLQA